MTPRTSSRSDANIPSSSTPDMDTPSGTLPATWLVECSDEEKTGGRWTLTLAPQATGICATCGKSIFGNWNHRA